MTQSEKNKGWWYYYYRYLSAYYLLIILMIIVYKIIKYTVQERLLPFLQRYTKLKF